MKTNTSKIKKELVALNAKINYVNKYYPDQTFLIDLYQEKRNYLEQLLVLNNSEEMIDALKVA